MVGVTQEAPDERLNCRGVPDLKYSNERKTSLSTKGSSLNLERAREGVLIIMEGSERVSSTFASMVAPIL